MKFKSHLAEHGPDIDFQPGTVRVPLMVSCSRSCLCLPAHYRVSLQHASVVRIHTWSQHYCQTGKTTYNSQCCEGYKVPQCCNGGHCWSMQRFACTGNMCTNTNTRLCLSSQIPSGVYKTDGIVMHEIRKSLPTNLEYLYLRAPSCRALDAMHEHTIDRGARYN